MCQKLRQGLFLSLYFLLSFNSLALEGEFHWERSIRLNKPLNQNDTVDWFGLGLQSKPTNEPSTFNFDTDLRFYIKDSNWFNFSLQEAYYNWPLIPDTQFIIGRKIVDWNINEKYWLLGYLNARQSFTLLSEDEEGLTGLFLKKELNNFSYEFMLSYFYIPQINPNINFENGNVDSHSEWSRLPPKFTVLSGTTVPIYYKLKKIDIAKIVLNKSLGFNLNYRWNTGALGFTALYKPESSLRSNAEAYYDNVVLNKVVVEADPTVNHHAYLGLQLQQRFGDYFSRFGLTHVDPNAKLGKDIPLFSINNSRKTFTSDYFSISPRYEKETYSHFTSWVNRDFYSLAFNYIHLLTKNVRKGDDFFSDSVKWKRALGFTVNLNLNEKWFWMGDIKYDLDREDNILKSEMGYRASPRLKINLGLEVLKAPLESSYWSYYRANDLMYASVAYVF